MRKTGKKLASSQKVRFGAVGIINTTVDFVTLNVLVAFFGVPLIPSNIVSTSVAMATSFTLNKKAVFGNSDGNKLRQLFLFMLVTLGGVWLVQTTVLTLVYHLLEPTHLHTIVLLNIGKIIGICVGLIWNWLWYSRVVFKQKDATK